MHVWVTGVRSWKFHQCSWRVTMATELTHLTHSPQPLPKLHKSHGNWSWRVNHSPQPLAMTLERANLSFQAQIRPQTYPNYKYTSLPLLSLGTHEILHLSSLHLHLLPQTKRERSFQAPMEVLLHGKLTITTFYPSSTTFGVDCKGKGEVFGPISS